MSARDAYAAREKKRLGDYRAAFKGTEFEKWVSSLSPADLERARKLGLLQPYIAHDGSTSDEADEEACSCAEATVDFYLPLEPGDSGYKESEVKDRMKSRSQFRLLRDFLCSYSKPKLAWACLRYLLGFGSCEEHGRALGMTRQAFHYHVQQMQKRLGLPPMGNQRSEKVRRQYALMNRRRLKAILTLGEQA